MHISRLDIENYRLLQNTTITCEEDLSIIVGKNNTGKTSVLSLLEKALLQKSKYPFSFYDFSLSCQDKMYQYIKGEDIEINVEDFRILLDIYIEYNNDDLIHNVSYFMLDLDPENKTVILRFAYEINVENLEKIQRDFKNYQSKKGETSNRNNIDNMSCFAQFMEKNHSNYFVFNKYSVLYDYKNNIIDNSVVHKLDDSKAISKLISLQSIPAKRSVANMQNGSKSHKGDLSQLAAKYYKCVVQGRDNESTVQEMENYLEYVDSDLSTQYKKAFKNVVDRVATLGGVVPNDVNLKIISSINSNNLLEENTTVVYRDSANHFHSLPEKYNGLGYLNLISMIFAIEIIMYEFKKFDSDSAQNGSNENPSDINILFIEEPEAHTHPQMQTIFIKNIKKILQQTAIINEASKINVQTFMTTHSSHIVAECDFDDIKYFSKTIENEIHNVQSKNLKDLEIAYASEKDPLNTHFKFLKQYLTLNRSEIFFADKIILIEGDTERILLPAMMKQIDQEHESDPSYIPLLSQNVSIIEVGNYAHIYNKFIQFLGIKTLIITDIDSCSAEFKKACPVADGHSTSNATINFFFKDLGDTPCSRLTLLQLSEKTFQLETNKEKTEWEVNADGSLLIVYQAEEKNINGKLYCARSFEDAFFHINRDFFNVKERFQSIKNFKYFADTRVDAYGLAEHCVGKKTSLAMDILLNSESKDNKDFTNWHTPQYIKEGLEWIQKN